MSVRSVSTFSQPSGSKTAGPTSMTLGVYTLLVVS